MGPNNDALKEIAIALRNATNAIGTARVDELGRFAKVLPSLYADLNDVAMAIERETAEPEQNANAAELPVEGK